jgi:hypothetical protein
MAQRSKSALWLVAALVAILVAYLAFGRDSSHPISGAPRPAGIGITIQQPSLMIQHPDSARPSEADLRSMDAYQLRRYLLGFQRATFTYWRALNFSDEYDYEDWRNRQRLHRQLILIRPARHRWVKAMTALRPPPALADEHAIMVRDARAVSAAWDRWIKAIEDSDPNEASAADTDVGNTQGQQSGDNRKWMQIMVAACRAAGIAEPRLVRRRLLV